MASSKPLVKIDIVCDMTCPFCWIGKRRLEKSMKRLEKGVDFEVHWLPYQLRPEAPYGGMPVPEEYKDSKVREKLLVMGEEEGIPFTFCYKSWPNTAQSHALLHLAGVRDGGLKQSHLSEVFFKTHFVDGTLLTEDVVVNIGQQAGYDPQEVRNYITDTNIITDINKESVYNKNRVTGMIPVYFFNGVEMIVGAQSEDEFYNKLLLAAQRVPDNANHKLA